MSNDDFATLAVLKLVMHCVEAIAEELRLMAIVWERSR